MIALSGFHFTTVRNCYKDQFAVEKKKCLTAEVTFYIRDDLKIIFFRLCLQLNSNCVPTFLFLGRAVDFTNILRTAF